MILQVPIALGYAPEERFTFRLDDDAIRQIFFFEECDISAQYIDAVNTDSSNGEDVLYIDIINEKLGNPKVTVTRPDTNIMVVKVKLSRGTANFYCRFSKDLKV